MATKKKKVVSQYGFQKPTKGYKRQVPKKAPVQGPKQAAGPKQAPFNYRLGPSQQPVSQSTHTPQQPQPQSLGQRTVQGVKKWFGGTPLGARITGGEVRTAIDFSNTTSEELRTSAMESVPIGGVVGKVGTAGKAIIGAGLKGKTPNLIAKATKSLTQEAAEKKLANNVAKLSKKGADMTANAANNIPNAKKLADIAAKKGAPKVPINTKSWRLSAQAFEKWAARYKYGLMATGLISSMVVGTISTATFSKMMAVNERNDVVQSIEIAVNGADEEFLEEAEEMLRTIDEGLSWADEHLLIWNYLDAGKTKKEFGPKILDLMKRVNKRKAENKKEEAAEFKQSALDLVKETTAIKEESFAKGGEATEARAEVKEINAEENRDFWEDYAEKKNFSAKENRDFWAAYQADKQKFWEEYQRRKEDQAPSKLKLGGIV